MSGPPAPPPVPGAATFVFTDWVARYPEFKGVSPPSAQMYFNEATLYCANKLGPVTSVQALTILLYMLTAHIAALNSPVTSTGLNPNAPPGRVSQATEGSVSVSFDASAEAGSKDWFWQTKYGAAYWQATLAYRLFRYRFQTPGPASLRQVPWQYPYGS